MASVTCHRMSAEQREDTDSFSAALKGVGLICLRGDIAELTAQMAISAMATSAPRIIPLVSSRAF